MEDDDIEDPLPFDKSADVIVVEERDYALWYRDLSEELASYDGTTVRFKGQVVVDKSIPNHCFIVGRPLMTCCADDIRFAGLVCEWGNVAQLQSRDWVMVEAEISLPGVSALDIKAARPGRGLVMSLRRPACTR